MSVLRRQLGSSQACSCLAGCSSYRDPAPRTYGLAALFVQLGRHGGLVRSRRRSMDVRVRPHNKCKPNEPNGLDVQMGAQPEPYTQEVLAVHSSHCRNDQYKCFPV